MVGWLVEAQLKFSRRNNAETRKRRKKFLPGHFDPRTEEEAVIALKWTWVTQGPPPPLPPWTRNNKFSTARPVTKLRGRPSLFLGPLTARHTRKTPPTPFLFHLSSSLPGKCTGGRGYKFPNNSNIVCRRDTPSPQIM